MKYDIIQNNFNGGEFGDSLRGRTDIVQYNNACEIVENFLPRSYGSVISMPGTRYVATVSDSTLNTRLIPFVFNRTDSYIIEMGDMYMRFFTNRGQVITPSGTETLTAFTANLIAHYKMNDNVGGTGTTLVLDAVGSYNGTASTVTSSLSTTAIVSTGFNLQGRYHISVSDNDVFTRTASTQPLTVPLWAYYSANGASQCLFSKSGEYELSVNSSGQLGFTVSSGEANTKLLLHCDGVDASTTVTDSSPSARTLTVSSAQITTAESVFGGASLKFTTTSGYLLAQNSADFNFGTGDFTIETRMLIPTADCQIIMSDGGENDWVNFYFQPGNFRLKIEGSATMTFGHSLSSGTWHHIALVRSGSTVTCYADGVALDTASNSSNITTTEPIIIGRAPTNPFTAVTTDVRFDEFRIVASAVWTSDFTPAGEAYQSGASNSWSAGETLTAGWHFIALVFKGDGTSSSDCKIYIDNVLASLTFSQDASFIKMSNTSSLFRIGTTSATGTKNWNGKMDNLAFIHQELSASDISSLYSSVAYQLTTVFTDNEVFECQFTQLNDVIWITHPNHPPQKLIRTSANEWTIADFAFIGGPFLDDNTTTTTITASATTGTVNITVTPTTANLFTLSSSTLGHHNSYWMIGGLAQTDVTTGLQEMGYVKVTHVINSYTATATVIKNLKVSSATAVWAEGAWSAVRGYPQCVSLHDWRLWFARTDHEPQKIWGSKNFIYENFSLDTQADDDGLNLPLASNESNEIQWLSSGNNLIAGTFGGAFIINSRSSETITPDNVFSNEEVGFGSSHIAPKKIGSFLYYVQRFGKKLREMFYNFDTDAFKAVDRTILSPHILGNGVVDMASQNNPETVLYCVLTSGTLATMSRETDQEVTGWARHTTSGTYTSVAVIPSQSKDYDEAWVIVERWIQGNSRKYIEFFEDITLPVQTHDCLYLHSALTYNAYESSSASSASISLSASSGSVTLTSSTAYFNGGQIGKRIRAIDSVGNTVGQGQITATASTTSITLSITTTFNALSYGPSYWGVSVSSVSGLSHLEAKTLGILADGLTESLTRTVASGVVTLGSNYFIIHCGLSYNQILFTLPKEAATERGTAQGKIQRFSEICFKLNKSTQNFKYGPDADNLDDINMAITPTVTSLYTGILPPQGGAIAMRGGYKRGAQIYIKNQNPLPMEILNIMGQLDTNEK